MSPPDRQETLPYFFSQASGNTESEQGSGCTHPAVALWAVVGTEDDVTGHVSLMCDCVYSKLLKGCLGLWTDAAKIHN